MFVLIRPVPVNIYYMCVRALTSFILYKMKKAKGPSEGIKPMHIRLM
jgi:hypothetical protein